MCSSQHVPFLGSMYGVPVQPFPAKCESLSNRLVWADQLAPQGLGPHLSPILQCNYGTVAPYTNPQVVKNMNLVTPWRVAGYPYVDEAASRLGPLLYNRVRDSHPHVPRADGGCECKPLIGWPYTFN